MFQFSSNDVIHGRIILGPVEMTSFACTSSSSSSFMYIRCRQTDLYIQKVQHITITCLALRCLAITRCICMAINVPLLIGTFTFSVRYILRDSGYLRIMVKTSKTGYLHLPHTRSIKPRNMLKNHYTICSIMGLF